MKIYTAPDVIYDEFEVSSVLLTSIITDVFGSQDDEDQIW